MELESPFLPGSDAVPAIWAGRELELADAERVARRRMQGIYERGRLVTGEFGIGKSVLVNRIARDLRSAGHLVTRTVRLPQRRDPIPLFADAVADAADGFDQSVGQAARRIKAITLPIVGGGVTLHDDPRTPESLLLQVGALLRQVGEAARQEQRLVVLRLDEVQNAPVDGLSSLLTLLGDALAETVEEVDPAGSSHQVFLPFVVYLSGLPSIRRRASEAGTAFSRRFLVSQLQPLDEPALRAALAVFRTGWEVLGEGGPAMVTMTQGCQDHIAERCLGDPFLFQLAGDATWVAATSHQITLEDARRGWRSASREARQYIASRYEHLASGQSAYLRAAAAIDAEERTSAAIATAMGRSTRELGSTLEALIGAHGLLVRTDDGRIAFPSLAVERHLRGDWP